MLVRLRPNDIDVGAVPGQWEHPIEFEDWLELRAAFAERRRPTPPAGLLTGILFCCDGHRMTRNGEDGYSCFPEPGEQHSYCGRRRVEAFAYRTCRHILERIPTYAIERTEARPRSEALNELARAQRRLRDAREQVADMMANAARYTGLFGAESYELSARRARMALEDAQTECSRIEVEVGEPDMDELRPALDAIAQEGFDSWWGRIGHYERRIVIGSLIERIDLLPKPYRAQNREVRVKLRQWVIRLGIKVPSARLVKGTKPAKPRKRKSSED